METKKSPVPYSLIGGILFAACALQELIWCVRSFSIWTLLPFIAFGVASTVLLLKKHDKSLLFTSSLLCLIEVITFINGFRYYQYTVWSTYDYDEKLSIALVLMNFLVVIAYGCILFLTVANTTSSLSTHAKTLNSLWFIPAILIAGKFFLEIVRLFVQSFDLFEYASYYHMGFPMAIHLVLIAGALFCYAGWIANPEEPCFHPNRSEANDTNTATTTTTVATPEHEAYCDLVKHILLLIFTFGIWLYIWIYKTTSYTNTIEDEEQRTPTNQLLLCLFVPFYIIYWTYKTAQRIDKMATAKGLSSDLTTLCLILEIFIPIIPPILLQEKMNHIVAPANASPTVKALPQKQATSTPAQSTQAAQATSPLGTAEEIRAFKELLDIGAITEEEFNAKKKQLLGL